MNGHFFCMLFLALATNSFGQLVLDTLMVEQRLYIKFDSISQKYTAIPDSLLASYKTVDSIRNQFNFIADSIQNEYQNTIAGINAEITKLTSELDSLRNLNAIMKKHIRPYERSLNNLAELRQEAERKFLQRLNALKAKTTDKLNRLDVPAAYKGPLQNITRQIDGVRLNTEVIEISGMKIDGVADTPSLSSIAMPANPDNLQKLSRPLAS